MKNNYRNYGRDVYEFLKDNAGLYTIKELVIMLNDKFNFQVERKKLAQYCIKMKIAYKYEKPKKSHGNTPTANGTIVVKTDGDLLKVKTGNHKWEYLQRKIYEEYYGVKLPEDVYVIFLDQNKRNFDIKNLKAVSRRNSAIMSKDGLFSIDSNVTKLGYTISNLKIKMKGMENNAKNQIY